MSEYGTAECIDCGATTERLLHVGFPHICQRCLFPPPKRDEDAQGAPPELRLTLALSLADRLDAMRGNGIWRGGVDAFGKGLPESQHQGKRE